MGCFVELFLKKRKLFPPKPPIQPETSAKFVASSGNCFERFIYNHYFIINPQIKKKEKNGKLFELLIFRFVYVTYLHYY